MKVNSSILFFFSFAQQQKLSRVRRVDRGFWGGSLVPPDWFKRQMPHVRVVRFYPSRLSKALRLYLMAITLTSPWSGFMLQRMKKNRRIQLKQKVLHLRSTTQRGERNLQKVQGTRQWYWSPCSGCESMMMMLINEQRLRVTSIATVNLTFTRTNTQKQCVLE